MLPSSREITLHRAVSAMSLTQDDSTLYLMDHACRFYRVDLETLSISAHASLSPYASQEDDLFNYYRRPLCIGQKMAYVAFAQSHVEHLVEIETKILPLLTLHYNDDAYVSKAAIGENDRYIITGNERGRSYIFSAIDGSLQADLPIASDVVSAVSVLDEYEIAARASFSKELVVYKINSRRILFEQKLDAVIEMMVFFNDRYLFAITRNSKLLKIDLRLGKVEKEITLDTSVWPSVITLSHSKKFLYIGTRESILFAIHVQTLDLLYQVHLPYQGITTLERGKKYFMIGFKTGEVVFYNHREFESELIQHLQLHHIKEAALTFQKNIFLMSHRETKKIYDFWLEEKEKVMALLASGAIEEAQTIAEPYLFHPKCKLEFNELEALQPDLMALHRYIRSHSFAAAYQLAHLKPLLKKSALYLSMEALWNKSLQKAQILLAREPLQNKEFAKDVLRLFEDVVEKQPIIDNMLKRSGIFMLAENAIKEKNFTFYFRLVAQNGFLEYTPLYPKVLQVAERLQAEIANSLDHKLYKQALILSDLLSQFYPYREQASRLKEVSKALMILEHQLEEHKLFDAIKTQEQYQLQNQYPLIQTLEEKKLAFYEAEEELIHQKLYSKAYDAIAPYFSLALCRQDVANLMRKLYLSQLNDAATLDDDSVDWAKTFLNYCHFFPTDKLLVEFAKQYHKLEILQSIVISPNDTSSPLYAKTVLSHLASRLPKG